MEHAPKGRPPSWPLEAAGGQACAADRRTSRSGLGLPSPKTETARHAATRRVRSRATDEQELCMRAPCVHSVREAMRQPDASEWRRRSLEKYEAQFVLFLGDKAQFGGWLVKQMGLAFGWV